MYHKMISGIVAVREEEFCNFRFHSDLEFERSISKRTMEDLQKEKEMLAVQFQSEKSRSKVELEKRVTDLLRQVDEKVQCTQS